MTTRSKQALRGANVDISTSGKDGHGEKDTAPYSRQSCSHHLRSGLSPVFARKNYICNPKKRTMPQTPLLEGEKITEPILGHDSSASPIIGRKRLLVGTGSQPYIFRTQKQVSLNHEGFDKENQNVPPKNNSACEKLLSPLCEKKNIMHMEKEINSSQVHHGNISKKVSAKRKIVAEKENFSTNGQFPVRKSKRINKDTELFMQKQDRTKISQRKDLAVEEDESMQKNVSSAVKVAESKQIKLSRNEDKNLQFVSKRTSERVRKNLNSSAEQESHVIQRAEVQVRKDKSHKSITSMEQRTHKKDLSSERSERTVSNKKTTVLTGRTVNRQVDKENSTPHIKAKGVKDQKQNPCNEKVRSSPAASRKTPKSSRIRSPLCEEVISQAVTVHNHTRKLSPKFTANNQASESSKSIDAVASSKSKQNKQKLPVWASERSTRRTPGKRKSIRIMGKGVYEFEFDSSEEVAKKRRVVKRKNQGRRTKPKPRTKQTLLTTDPNWKDPLSLLPIPVVSSSSREDVEYVGTAVNLGVNRGNESVGSSVNSSLGGDTESPGTSVTSEHNLDDDFDTHDNQDDNFDGFEFETVSSFVAQGEPSTSIPMTSASVTNTPAIGSHISKYLGGSSTPRVVDTLPLSSSEEVGELQAPKTVKDDIAICFGFDNNDTEAEDSELSLSPVRWSGLQSHLEVIGTSDIVEVESQPSRFSWSSRKSGSQSYISANYSSSMQVHGRSLSSSSSSSTTAQSRKKKLKKTKLGESVVSHRKKVEDSHHDRETRRGKARTRNLAQPVTSKPQEPLSEDANTTILFEEEEGMESQMELDKEKQSESSRKDHFSEKSPPLLPQTPAFPSPEKSFSKPPRKSYDRMLLDQSRLKFIRECGGYIATETETEEDDAVKKKPQRKKKPLRSKKAPRKKNNTKLSQSSDISSLSNTSITNKTKTSKKSHKDSAFEASFREWKSSINDHFSEIEDHDLLVM